MTQVEARAGDWRAGRAAAGRPLVVLPGTYRAQHDSFLLADVVREAAPGRRVLDVCTGSGVLALAAASAGARSVTAVDLSRRSVLSARINSAVSGAGLRVCRGDLLEPVAGESFDLVVCNPPYVPSASDRLPRHGRARCWDGGVLGRSVVDRLCDQVGSVLAPGGTLLLVHTAVIGVGATLERLAGAGLDARVAMRRRIPFGPVMTARREALRQQGLIGPDEEEETLVVIEGNRA